MPIKYVPRFYFLYFHEKCHYKRSCDFSPSLPLLIVYSFIHLFIYLFIYFVLYEGFSRIAFDNRGFALSFKLRKKQNQRYV